MANLIYKGLKANLPESRNANSIYFVTDTKEIYFGNDLYTDPVRFYTADKPDAPAQGVLYVNETTGAGDVWNGTSWKNVIKAYAVSIGDVVDDNTVPTSKAVKDYVDNKVTGGIGKLGALAQKDKVAETDLEAELSTKINNKAEASDVTAMGTKVDALIGADAGKSARTIANEELAAQLIPGDAKEALNTLTEIAAWIQKHPDDAAAMNAKIQAVETQLTGIGAESGAVKAYVDAAIAALKIGDYAKAAELTAAVKRIEALEKDTHTHANKALLDTYTQTEVDLKDAVAKKHTHANAAELDKIAAGDKAKWDAAEAKAHEHANKEELDKIATGDKAKWDAAEGNAKQYADGLNTAMDTRVKAVEQIVTVGTF